MEQVTTSARVVSVTKEQGGVALIHLNRPPANSYDRQFIDDLNAAIDEIRFDEAIGAAVLMSDLPKFFSAGADIGMFRSVTPTVAGERWHPAPAAPDRPAEGDGIAPDRQAARPEVGGGPRDR